VAFYTPSEVSCAKDVVFKVVDQLSVDGLPRTVARRKSDDRVKLEVEDILNLMDCIGERALMGQMLKFVAHDPSRLPPFNPPDLNMCLRVAALEERFSSLLSQARPI